MSLPRSSRRALSDRCGMVPADPENKVSRLVKASPACQETAPSFSVCRSNSRLSSCNSSEKTEVIDLRYIAFVIKTGLFQFLEQLKIFPLPRRSTKGSGVRRELRAIAAGPVSHRAAFNGGC